MQSEREEIIESVRQRLRILREHLVRKLGGQWPEESALQQAMNEVSADVPVLQELQKTEFALQSIRQGTYGVCTTCNDEIAGERLEVVPFAQVCIRCQMQVFRTDNN